MSIEKLAEFAKDGDKNLDNLDVNQGFLQSEKPERQWFNQLLNNLTRKTNEVIDGIAAQKLDTGITATAKTGGIDRQLVAVNAERITFGDFSSKADAINYAKDTSGIVQILESTTILIPTDCATLQDAIDYTGTISTRVKVDIKIESGHKLTHGLRIVDGEYSNYSISSVDAEVKLSANFQPADSSEFPTAAVEKISIFAFLNCRAPVLKTIINAELVSTSLNGFMCGFGGQYRVYPGCGVKGARTNLECREGVFYGGQTVWEDSYEFNARFTAGTFFSARDSKFSRSFVDSNGEVYVTEEAGGVLVSRGSHGNLQGSVFTDHQYSGISVRRSHVSLIVAKFNNVSPWAIMFFDGGIAVCNGETLVNGEKIKASQISIDGFNAVWRRGLCLNSGAAHIEVKTTAAGTLVKYPDGWCQVFSPSLPVDITTADGALFRSALGSWDYSSLITLTDGSVVATAHKVAGGYNWFATRPLGGRTVQYQAFGGTSYPGAVMQVTVSGYWSTVN